MVLGQCKLCLTPRVELQDSHFLPRGVYKALRGNDGPNPNPWLVTKTSSVQTSRQLTAPLLCSTCEQRLNSQGERWVLKNSLHADNTFPLADLLNARPPDVSKAGEKTRIYYAQNISGVDIKALAYFGTSIFWRGSIHPWGTDGKYPISLGPRQEDFRRYLLGEAEFPTHSMLWVFVRDRGQFSHFTGQPNSVRVEFMRVHRFPMPGLAFTLTVGRKIWDDWRQFCIVRGPGNPIIAGDKLEPLFEETSVKMLQRIASIKRRSDIRLPLAQSPLS